MARVALRRKCSPIFFIRELDRGKIIIDPTRFVADPDKARRVPGTALSSRCGWAMWPATISTPISGLPLSVPSTGRSIAGCSCRSRWASRAVSRPDQAGRTDGRRLSARSANRYSSAFPIMRSSAFERRMLFERAGERLIRARRCRVLRSRLDRPELLNGRVADGSSSVSRVPRDRSARLDIRPRATMLPKSMPIRVISAGARLPSPSRHIYNPLTIAVAFRGLGAFDRVRQGPIKVDGTFA